MTNRFETALNEFQGREDIIMDITTIEQMPIFGNAHSDYKLFNDIHEFLMNPDNAMSDKIRAFVKLDKAVGADGVCDEAAVNAYIEIEA